jgi:alginate O-acetyltransferase complex protein AlgI
MTFSSGLFLFLFLPLFLAVYHALPHSFRSPWLLAASWVFYAWWRVDFLAILLTVSLLSWIFGRLIAAERERRRPRARALVITAVSLFVGILAYFKYADFGIEGMNALFGVFGAREIPALHVVLPVGISFYLFKAIAYLVDVYRGTVPRAGGLLTVSGYISIFPQVISGPIDRYGDLAPQFGRDDRSFSLFSEGAIRFMMGFCKKALVADTIAPVANAVFALSRPSLADAWLGAAAYTMQLYFDFSGYSDMAVGLGKMMGLRLMENFRQPYLAGSITDFWKRWHIGLSSWLRDYLYIPLGGNRKGPVRTCINLAIVMVLGGLWHGAALSFAAWGAWHGALLVIERLRGKSAWRNRSRPLAVCITMILVAIGWVLFRAQGLDGAARMFAGMAGLNGILPSPDLAWRLEASSLTAVAAAFLIVYAGPWLAGRAAAIPWGRRLTAGARLAVLPLYLLGILKIVAESAPAFLYARF